MGVLPDMLTQNASLSCHMRCNPLGGSYGCKWIIEFLCGFCKLIDKSAFYKYICYLIELLMVCGLDCELFDLCLRFSVYSILILMSHFVRPHGCVQGA